MTFYRVLTSPEAITRWRENKFTASHCLLVGDWQRLYYKEGKRDTKDFPRRTALGTYSVGAVEAFIRLASNYLEGALWDREDLCKASEIDGVCAFKTPALALEYANNGFSMIGILIAVFDGTETGQLPEEGGVCVQVTNPIEVLTPAQFKQKYCP